jgi:hypothetical protein
MAFDRFVFTGADCAICLCIVLQASAGYGDESSLPDQPQDYAAIIRPQLPLGWRCTYDFRTLVISYDEQATFLNTLGLPFGEHTDEFYKKYGFHGSYLIVMKFVSRLSEEDQRALANRRRQAVDEARIGREREKYTGSDVYERHFVPEYFNNRFSIDLQTSDFWPLKLVAPADAVKQRDAILKLLQANLQKYPAQP